MKTDDELHKLFEGVVPEQFNEIKALINEYSAKFRRIRDREGFRLTEAFGTINYTHRSMQQMWLFCHAGRLSLHCYASLIFFLKSHRLELDLVKVKKLEGQEEADKNFDRLLDKIIVLA